jgi:hypothetical protein
MNMRAIARSVTLLAAAAVGCTAASAARYAVVPLVGQQLTIVHAQPVTSTNLDRNRYESLPFTDDVFDRTIRSAIDQVVKARQQGDQTLLVGVSMPAAALAVDGADALAAAREDIVAAVAPRAVEAGAEYLILVLPHRAPPALRTVDGNIGTGRVAGIGLYVNRFQRTSIVGQAEVANGFLGLFANFRIQVVDARSRALLAEEVGTVGYMFSASLAGDTNPLTALTSEQKIAGLRTLLHDELTRIVPGLLARAVKSP